MSIKITLPDGNIREYENPLTGLEVAESIGPKLAKDSICIEINNSFKDLSFVINEDSDLRILTNKDLDSLHILRHSSAHILAQAVLNLYPNAQFGVGPSIENGFYYDFLFEKPISEDELPKIEDEMARIASLQQSFIRTEITKEEASKHFNDQSLKLELIETAESSEGITEENVSIYSNDKFKDLCMGPHVPNTSILKTFQINKNIWCLLER